MHFFGTLVNILSDGPPKCASNEYGGAEKECKVSLYVLPKCNRRKGVYRIQTSGIECESGEKGELGGE